MGFETALIGIAASQAGLSLYQGEQQRKSQSRSLRRQDRAQEEAERQAIGARRRAEQENAAQNRRRPDVASLLGMERSQARTGPASTLLTGPTGVQDNLLLGGQSRLGG